MSKLSTGHASTIINQPPETVWKTVTDITRMGEWSPECTSGRWVSPADGPAVGAKFEGDNEVKLAGRSLKKWTTTSEVTVCDPFKTFAFVAENYTTWTYQLDPSGAGTKVTESFSYTAAAGLQGFIYGVLMQRPRMITKGMNRTLARIKASLES